MFALIASFVRHIGNYPVETEKSIDPSPQAGKFYVGRFNVAYMTRKQSQRDGRSPFFVKNAKLEDCEGFQMQDKS